MGILDRVKNMFTEEVEEPIKVAEVKVEKEDSIEKEDIKEETEPVKAPEKPMPIFFDDNDFATLEKPKVKEEKNVVEEKYYTKKTETTEKKVFKLSPVISPVYGVLDKNYHKEDITPKRPTPKVSYYDKESITIDDVRKKAYGTLEDELETSLVSNEKTLNDEVIGSRMQRKYHNDIMLEDLMDPDYSVKESKHKSSDSLDNDSLQTLEPIALDDFLLASDDNKDSEEDYKNPLDDTLTESDLFHLIDSMYDKEEE